MINLVAVIKLCVIITRLALLDLNMINLKNTIHHISPNIIILLKKSISSRQVVMQNQSASFIHLEIYTWINFLASIPSHDVRRMYFRFIRSTEWVLSKVNKKKKL